MEVKLSRFLSRNTYTNGMWKLRAGRHWLMLVDCSQPVIRVWFPRKEKAWYVISLKEVLEEGEHPNGLNRAALLQGASALETRRWLQETNLDRPFPTRREAVEAVKSCLAVPGVK